MLPAAETMERLALRIHHERRVAVLVERAPGPVVPSARGKLNVARDEVLDSDGAFEALDFLVPRGARLRRHGNRFFYPPFLRQRPRGLKQADKFLSAPAKAHKELGHVAALADFFGQPDDARLRDHPHHSLRPRAPRRIVIEAYKYRGNFAQDLGPFGPER